MNAAPPPRQMWRTVGTVASTALVLYGTYQAVQWLWTHRDDAACGSNESESNGNSNQNESENDTAHKGPTGAPARGRHGPHTRSAAAFVYPPQHMTTVHATLPAMWPLLRRRIDALVHIAEPRRELRALRSAAEHPTNMAHQQDALWMTIQIESLTKYMSTVYAYTMLYTVLTIQVHLLLGHPHRQFMGIVHPRTTPHSIDAPSLGAPLDVLQGTYNAFWETGLAHGLVPRVRCAVTCALRDWHVCPVSSDAASVASTVAGTSNVAGASNDSASQSVPTGYLSLDAWTTARDEIRRAVEHDSSLPPLLTACWIPSESMNSPTDSTSNDALLCETYDLWESPVALQAVTHGLDAVFAHLQEHSWNRLFGSHVPLARVIAHTKGVTNGLFVKETKANVNAHSHTDVNDASPCNYLTVLQQVPAMHEVARVSLGE